MHKSNFRHVNIVPYMLSKLLKKVENRLSSFSSVDPARQKIILRKKVFVRKFSGDTFGQIFLNFGRAGVVYHGIFKKVALFEKVMHVELSPPF